MEEITVRLIYSMNLRTFKNFPIIQISKWRLIVFCTLVALIGVYGVYKFKVDRLDEAHAISRGEWYVFSRGYTGLSISGKSLFPQFGLLESKAYGVCYKRREGTPGWTIVFCYRGDSKRGRAVTMDLDGGNIKIEHLDFILEKVDKRLP